MKKFFAAISFFLFFIIPALSFAVTETDIKEDVEKKGRYFQSVVPCGYTVTELNPNGTVRSQDILNPCDFDDFIKITHNILMGWIMVGATIATMGFAYAGYLYITAMGSEEKIGHAHSIFYKTVLGFAFMLGAWLVAYTFERTFLCSTADVTAGKCKDNFITRSFLKER